jgi:glycosyltransferase involved in cell wall biosynthesis
MQKIIIDGNVLVEDHFSGIGQYSANLINSFDQLLSENKYKKDFSIKLFVCFDKKNEIKKYQFKNIKVVYLPIKLRYYNALFHRNLLPPLDLLLGRGTYIFPKFISTKLFSSPSIPIIYDLTFKIVPQYGEPNNVNYLQKNIKKTIDKAKKIITISNNSKKDIVKFYRVSENKIIVAYPAANPDLFYPINQQIIQSAKEKYCIKKDYILSLSNLEPRKNIESIIEAYCQYIDQNKKSNIELVIFGAGGWKNNKLKNMILDKKSKGYNINTPKKKLTDQDKPSILSGANLLIFIPFYEGFGMPPLEALSCGTPIIMAKNSSMTEISTYEPFLVQETDIKEIVKKIKNIINNNIFYKQKIIENKNIYKKFSWQESAKKILDNL